MLNINITLRDAALNVGRDLTINVDENLAVRDLIGQLVSKLEWPQLDIFGHPLLYAIRVERVGAIFTGEEAIKACGFLNGDIITIGPIVQSSGAAVRTYPSSISVQTVEEQAQPQNPAYVMKPLKRP